jgi:hypothetical protein
MPAWLVWAGVGLGAWWLLSSAAGTVKFGTPLGNSAIQYVQQILAMFSAYNAGNDTAAIVQTGLSQVQTTAINDTSVPPIDLTAISALINVGNIMGQSAINYMNQILALYTAYNQAQSSILNVVQNLLQPGQTAANTQQNLAALQQQVLAIYQQASKDTTVSSADLQSLAAIISN